MTDGSPRLRLTGPTLKVLRELLEHPTDGLSGAEITRTTRLASGTLYPILFRLEAAGWLESEWEEVSPTLARRPRRRLYRMTGVGQKSALAAFRSPVAIDPDI